MSAPLSAVGLLAIGSGGFAGAIARYLLSHWAHRVLKLAFPVGTLLVNLLGCFLIGLLVTLIETRQVFSPAVRLLLITGFLGSLTTFSTFGFETVELVRVGSYGAALLNALANVILGVAAVMLARAIVLHL